MSEYLSRADRTQTRSFLDVELDHETGLANKLELLIMTGMKNEQGKTAKGDAAFGDGTEHVVFRYSYDLQHQKVDKFEIPRAAQKMLR